jgi:hypothetical protein
MLYTDRIKNLESAFPELICVQKSDDPGMPSKAICISDSALRNAADENGFARATETAAASDDQLLPAA